MWVVCRKKDNRKVFIVSAQASKTIRVGAFHTGNSPDSIVLKKFPSYDEALQYKKEIERIDDELNDILP